MSRILVTGGAGFIGSNLSEFLLEKGFEVIILDNFSTGRRENIQEIEEDVEILNLDIRELNKLKEHIKNIDYIFHLAAFVSVPDSVKNKEETFEINVKGTRNLLKIAEDLNVKKFVMPSSAAVYGEDPELPKTENSVLDPRSPYAESKIEDEKLLKEFSDSVETVGLRLFNVYGSKQNPNSDYAAVVPIFIKRALENKDLVIYGDGEQTRDFIYVKDVCEAFFKTLNTDVSGQIINIASGKELSVQSLAEKIIELTNSKSKIIHSEPRPGDIKRSVASIEKAKEKLDFEPKYSLEKGLKEILTVY